MPRDCEHDIFISFSSQDSAKAKSICGRLESEGFGCWISSRDVKPGENYQAAIVAAIKSAKVMVLVFSSSANLSNEILKELSLASAFKVSVIPVRTVDVTPQGAFLYELITRQWIDAFKRWDAAMDDLVRTAKRIIEGSDDPVAETAPAVSNLKATSLPTASSTIPEGELEAARVTMTRFVGPIAKLLVRKAAASARSVEEFYARLIAGIPAQERADCMAQLRRTAHSDFRK